MSNPRTINIMVSMPLRASHIMLPFIAISKLASKASNEDKGSPKFKACPISRVTSVVNTNVHRNMRRDR